MIQDFVLLEDRLAPPGAVAAHLFTQVVSGYQGQDLAALKVWLAGAQAAGYWVVTALDYELGYVLEPAAAPPGWQVDPQNPPIRCWAFAQCQPLTAEEAESWIAGQLAHLPPSERQAGIGGLGTPVQRVAYEQGVARLLGYIAAGDCYQVNYTFPLNFDWYGHPLALYQALRRQQPVAHGGMICLPDCLALSLSPELFVQKTGAALTVRPMKGTAPRGANEAEDHAQRAWLQASEKNRAENLMIVDLLRNDLGRLAAPGSVAVDGLFEVETYPSVHQMVSQVTAQAPDAGLAEVLAALFPCGSITGAPKIRAMQIAAELEPGPRGLYTGSVGMVAPDGDFRLNVAIRTLVLGRDGKGRMGVGSGVVTDSDPACEWEECLLKSAFLQRHDPGLELIETLRLEVLAGLGTYPLLPWHMARFADSARWLGYAWDEAAVAAVLAGAAQQADGVWRVRLGLNKAGEIKLAVAPLGPEPAGPRLLRLASETIDERNPLRRHKTSARGLYDRALQAIAATPEVFDVLFLNQQAEVAEGARSNVFALLDGVWTTPPLASGCLPGVLRAKLLAEGQVKERPLSLSDLRQAQGLRCGNALRGWVDVVLAEAP